jgi:nicotinamide mononucleotide transporter
LTVSDLIGWFKLNGVELLGTITGLIYIYFSIRQEILLWFFGILNALLLIWVYFTAGIYAYMLLQFYYLFISIYGWIHWKRGGDDSGGGELPVTRVNGKLAFILFVTGLVLTFIIALVLALYTDSTIPRLDGFTTAFSIIATWMLARKILEHWLIWIVVDLLSCGIYVFKHLYLMTILFAVYTILAVFGYLSWRKSIQTNS